MDRTRLGNKGSAGVGSAEGGSEPRKERGNHGLEGSEVLDGACEPVPTAIIGEKGEISFDSETLCPLEHKHKQRERMKRKKKRKKEKEKSRNTKHLSPRMMTQCARNEHPKAP